MVSGRASSSRPTKRPLIQKIRRDADAIDLDGLIQDISQLFEILENKSTGKKPATDHYWPDKSCFLKFKKFFKEGCASVQEVFTSFPILEIRSSVAIDIRKFLDSLGRSNWAFAPLLVIADVLGRFENDFNNKKKCLSLLKETYILCLHIRNLRKHPSLMKSMEAVIKEATANIVETSFMCCWLLNMSMLSRLLQPLATMKTLKEFKEGFETTYTHIHSEMGYCIFNAIECSKVRPPGPRERHEYPKHAVGLETPVNDIIKLLNWKSEKKSQAVIIYGLGGMGKTILADAAFARLYIKGCKYSMVRFDSTSNVVDMQKWILKDLMNGTKEVTSAQQDINGIITDMEIRTYEKGQEKISAILKEEVAFIYIDNVPDKEKLGQLLPKNLENVKKLRILFTTRDEDLCRGCLPYRNVQSYPMKVLPDRKAEELLKSRGIHERNFPQLNTLVKDICGGIPKLLDKAADRIDSERDKQGAFGIVRSEHIRHIKEHVFAYERLPKELQGLFLDICLFFRNLDWNKVKDIVKDDRNGNWPLEQLKRKALVIKGSTEELVVPDVVWKIGKEMAKETMFRFFFARAQSSRKEKSIESPFYEKSITALSAEHKSLRILALHSLTEVKGNNGKIFEKKILLAGKDHVSLEKAPYIHEFKDAMQKKLKLHSIRFSPTDFVQYL